jgi:hypothetical protein
MRDRHGKEKKKKKKNIYIYNRAHILHKVPVISIVIFLEYTPNLTKIHNQHITIVTWPS